MATWLAGWVAVCHSRYCIKTTKSILKPFRLSDSPKGKPIQRGRKYTGIGKIGDFRLKLW